jgi:hypothetical protein
MDKEVFEVVGTNASDNRPLLRVTVKAYFIDTNSREGFTH